MTDAQKARQEINEHLDTIVELVEKFPEDRPLWARHSRELSVRDIKRKLEEVKTSVGVL